MIVWLFWSAVGSSRSAQVAARRPTRRSGPRRPPPAAASVRRASARRTERSDLLQFFVTNTYNIIIMVTKVKYNIIASNKI